MIFTSARLNFCLNPISEPARRTVYKDCLRPWAVHVSLYGMVCDWVLTQLTGELILESLLLN